jgi:Mg2+-importing ATPase
VRAAARAVELARDALNPLAAILLVAAVASTLAGEGTNALIIGVIVASSAAIGVWQKARSDAAVRRLQARIAPTATVYRDGARREVPRSELVVGDVVHLSAGDLVPADARLIESADLHVQQAALTGESLPVEKAAVREALVEGGPDSRGLVFLGTSVIGGSATAVVFASGEETAFGDVVKRLASAPEETEFDRGTRRFGVFVLETVLVLVVFILLVSLGLDRDPLQSLLFAVALAVGLTPEFLPMITTVTLARGAVRMARDKVIVKHLSAIQNLGSIDVLCSDKTGTLTEGTIALERSLDPLGEPAEAPLRLAHVNSAFETGIKSPLDAAILRRCPEPPEGFTKTDEIPFDFERRRLSVVVQRGGAHELVTKGAPEGILAACTRWAVGGEVRPLDADALARSREVVRAASAEGLRVLAVARRDVPCGTGFSARDEHGLVLVGFLTFADRPVAGARESLRRLREDGVAVKILTGDDELVARHVCGEVGIDVGRAVLGAELEGMTEAELGAIATGASLFARVSPAQKQRILRALKARGHVVGFLGDGVNDAPSLHSADVGISVAGAVDVAREAADIVLLERRLDVLHSGILAGREAFGNVLKYLLMGTSSNFGNMFSMAGAAVFLPFLPMLPAQILLNNFLYDVAQIAIPTDRVDRALRRRPHRWDIGLIRRFMLIVGPISSLFDFATFFVLLRVFALSEAGFQTGWFVESLVTQTLVLFVIRTARRPWSNRPSGPLIVTTLLVVLVGIALPYTKLGPALGFVPLPAAYFAFLVVTLGVYLTVVEAVKHRILGRLLERGAPPVGSYGSGAACASRPSRRARAARRRV